MKTFLATASLLLAATIGVKAQTAPEVPTTTFAPISAYINAVQEELTIYGYRSFTFDIENVRWLRDDIIFMGVLACSRLDDGSSYEDLISGEREFVRALQASVVVAAENELCRYL
jgi:hypothetical protein